MIFISSLLVLGDSNTGCSSIRSVRSALEGVFSGRKRRDWREKEWERSEEREEELLVCDCDPLLERDPSFLTLVCESSSLTGWLFFVSRYFLCSPFLSFLVFLALLSSGDSDLDLAFCLLCLTGDSSCLALVSCTVSVVVGLSCKGSSGDSDLDLCLVTV